MKVLLVHHLTFMIVMPSYPFSLRAMAPEVHREWVPIWHREYPWARRLA